MMYAHCALEALSPFHVIDKAPGPTGPVGSNLVKAPSQGNVAGTQDSSAMVCNLPKEKKP
jgi:hypothetical protein